MKLLWCWRCRMKIPMLDEEEYAEAYRLYGVGMGNRSGSVQERFKELLDFYYKTTGVTETIPNAVMHHRIAQYGPPCVNCGKPYRTPKASFCPACGHKRPFSKKKLNISFDLDDTLIPSMYSFPTEHQTFLQRIGGIEKMRKGTLQLMEALRAEGHSIFIYTTSLRSPANIKKTFLAYGVQIDKIINKTVHDKNVEAQQKQSSKYPPAFGIDLHIDDSKGVEIEGNRFDFKTLIIPKETTDWVTFVIDGVRREAKTFL